MNAGFKHLVNKKSKQGNISKEWIYKQLINNL